VRIIVTVSWYPDAALQHQTQYAPHRPVVVALVVRPGDAGVRHVQAKALVSDGLWNVLYKSIHRF